MQNEYDPMKEFWVRFFPFLFRQAPVIVFMSVAISAVWYSMGEIKREGRLERIEIRKECAASISEMRDELRHCVSQKDTLIKENIALSRRVAALEAKLKR